jgi:hypothetical protein
MNITKMISELQAEKARLDEAIAALERLSEGTKTKRRRRSPAAKRDDDSSSANADVAHSRPR